MRAYGPTENRSYNDRNWFNVRGLLAVQNALPKTIACNVERPAYLLPYRNHLPSWNDVYCTTSSPTWSGRTCKLQEIRTSARWDDLNR